MQPERNGVIVWHPYEKPEPGLVVEQHEGYSVINTDRLLPPETYWDADRVDFLVQGDLWKCPRCDYEVISDFGEPIMDTTHNQEALRKWVKISGQRGEAYRITRT